MDEKSKDINSKTNANKTQCDTKSQLLKALNSGNDIEKRMVYVTEGHKILFSKGNKN